MPLFQINDGQVSEFTEEEIAEEKLRTLFEKYGLKFVETGLQFVDRNVPVGNGFIDTLAIDDQKRLVIIEYKVNESGTGDAFAQALSYASYIVNNQERFARIIKQKISDSSLEEEDIDFENLKIVIVAPDFRQHVVNAASQVEPYIKLLKYRIFKSNSIENLSTETIFDSSTRRSPSISSSYTIEEHFAGRYGTMKPVFDKLQNEIKNQLGVIPYPKKQFIAFKRNYIFIVVHVFTDKIELGLSLPEESNPPQTFVSKPEYWGWSRLTHVVKLSKPEDVNEELLKWIEAAYNYS